MSLAGRVSWTFVGIGGLPANMAVSLLLSAVVLWGFVRTARERVTVAEILVPISLVITVLWPFWSFRFVLPLTPFLYLYFVKGLTVSPTLPVARVALADGDRAQLVRSRRLRQHRCGPNRSASTG